MPKKADNIEELLNKVRKEIIDRSALMLKRMMNGETVDKEERKELKDLKAELRDIERMQMDMNGGKKASKISDHLTEDLIAKVKSLSTTVGDIVRSNKIKEE